MYVFVMDFYVFGIILMDILALNMQSILMRDAFIFLSLNAFVTGDYVRN